MPNTAELHGHALFHGKEDWEPVATMPRARIGVYNAAFDAIASTRAAILIRGVDLKRLENRYVYPDHPHAVVLSHLLERIDDHARIVEQDVLVIADQVDLADEYRKNLWRFQRFSTGGRSVRRRVRSWRSWP